MLARQGCADRFRPGRTPGRRAPV